MTEQDKLQERSYPADNWVTELYKDKKPDALSDGDFAEVLRGISEGKSGEAVLEEQAAQDPNVLLKNKLLAKLDVLARDPKTYTADLLSLMERQAITLDEQPDETRYRQFMGLLSVVVECFSDEELHELFESQKDSLNQHL